MGRMGRWIFVAMLALVSGCATVRPLSIYATNDLYRAHPEGFDVVGMVEGSSSTTQFLFFPPNGDAGYRAAIDDALKKANADALINIVSDVRASSGLFIAKRTTIVRGLAIKKKP